MADRSAGTTLRYGSADPQARRPSMHPFGIYLALTDSQREYAAADRRASFAKVDASPLTEPEPVPRRMRLAATLRRHFMRTASA